MTHEEMMQAAAVLVSGHIANLPNVFQEHAQKELVARLKSAYAAIKKADQELAPDPFKGAI